MKSYGAYEPSEISKKTAKRLELLKLAARLGIKRKYTSRLTTIAAMSEAEIDKIKREVDRRLGR